MDVVVCLWEDCYLCDGAATKICGKGRECTARWFLKHHEGLLGFYAVGRVCSICSEHHIRKSMVRTTGTDSGWDDQMMSLHVENSRKRFDEVVIRCVPVSQSCKGSAPSSGVMRSSNHPDSLYDQTGLFARTPPSWDNTSTALELGRTKGVFVLGW